MIDDDIGHSTVSANEAEAFPGLPTTEQRQQPTTSAWELRRRRELAAQVCAHTAMANEYDAHAIFAGRGVSQMTEVHV